MKKILFTLVALLTGMSAMAYNVELRLVDAEGNPCNEITAKAGDEVTLHMQLTAIEGIVNGVQMEYVMKTPEGERIDAENGVVVIKGVKPNPFSPAVRFTPEGMSLFDGNATAETFNTNGEIGNYRLVGSNTTQNMFWAEASELAALYGMSADDIVAYYGSKVTLGNVYSFTVQINEGWEDEYAMLDLNDEYTRFAITDGSQFRGEFPDMDLKIINGDYVAPGPKDLTGEIIIGDPDEDGYVTIEYTGDEDVTIRVMIDGVYVPLTDGKVFLGAYGEAEITVEVTAEGYNPMTATKVVNWEQPVLPPTPAPVITYETTDTEVIITATGEGTVVLYVNNVEVENPYHIARGDADFSVIATATAQGEGMDISPVTTLEILVPALVQDLDDLTGEIVVSEPDENGIVTVTYTGDEDVTIVVTVNGEVVDGDVQLADGENVIVVTVTAEGYNPMEETFTVTWTAPEPPYETPAPVITTELTEDDLVITATGEGTVTLYIQYIDNETGDMTLETYVGEGTVTVPVARGEETTYINYWAVAQANDEAVPGMTGVSYYVEVPAKDGDTPVDPHMVGKWIIIIDKDGNEHWYAMNADPNGETNWSLMMTLHHNPWGDFDVPFYFMVDGVRMGAESDMYQPAMGDMSQTILNPVYEGENLFCVPGTYTYTWGLQYKDGEWYLLVAQGAQTGINELVDGKTIANVRYFNMAGQEMQEANGMTIVVTTYTDGTTNTAKVMK